MVTKSSASTPFLLGGMAAGWTDQLIFLGKKSFLLSPCRIILARLVSCIIFPLFASLDVLVQGSRFLFERSWAKLAKTDISRSAHGESAQKCWEIAERCFAGAFYSQWSWVSPDIVTHHFVPSTLEKGDVRAYGKHYTVHRIDERYPKSVEELQELLIHANETNTKVAVAGSLMSQGKHSLPPDGGMLLHLNELNSVELDVSQKLARVGAGATWRDLQEKANNAGLAVQVMQASNIFTIGGSISANCHGWDHHQGPIINTVRSLTIVDTSGQVREVLPSDELFSYILGGYGGFGAIVSATLALTDNLSLLKTGEEMAPGDYVEHFLENVQGDETIAMHLYRLSLEPGKLFRSGISVNYSKRKGNQQPVLNDEPLRGHRLDRVKLQIARRFGLARKIGWELEKRDALRPERITRNEIMRPPINPTLNFARVDAEWLQEYFVPGEHLAQFLEYLAQELQKNNVALLNASVRFVKRDATSKLSYAESGDRFAVVLFFNQSLLKKDVDRTSRWVSRVIDYAANVGGSYYLPYQHFATHQQFHKCYPHWKEVAEKRINLDPKGTFSNGFYKDYFPTNYDAKSARK